MNFVSTLGTTHSTGHVQLWEKSELYGNGGAGCDATRCVFYVS